MKTYAELNKALGQYTERILEPRAKVKVVKNADRSITVWWGKVALVHHDEGGGFRLNAGGVRTPRLLRLMNKYSPLHIKTLNGTWVFEHKSAPLLTVKGASRVYGYRFFDGCGVDGQNTPVGTESYSYANQWKRERTALKHYAVLFIDTLAVYTKKTTWLKIIPIEVSDCVYCTVRVNKDTTLGEIASQLRPGETHPESHIVGHCRRHEFPVALLCRAVEESDVTHRDEAVIVLDKFMKKKASEAVRWTPAERKLLETILMNYLFAQRGFALTTSGI